MTSNSELARSAKFVAFELSAGVIQIVSYSVLDVVTALPYWPCYLIALVLSVVWSFTFNRKYTFRSANNVPVAMAKVALFYAMFTPVSTVAGGYAADVMGANGTIVTLVAMVFNFVLEYLWDRFFVFGASMDTNAVAVQAATRAK